MSVAPSQSHLVKILTPEVTLLRKGHFGRWVNHEGVSTLITGAPENHLSPPTVMIQWEDSVCSCQIKLSENWTPFPTSKTFLGFLDLINCISSVNKRNLGGRVMQKTMYFHSWHYSFLAGRPSILSFMIKQEEAYLYLGCPVKQWVQRSAQRGIEYLVPTFTVLSPHSPDTPLTPLFCWRTWDFVASVQ